MPAQVPGARVACAQEWLLVQGDWHFGSGPGRLRTLLGSCVGVTLWHPGRRVGAMCHYLLPDRRRPPGAPLDGRFGDEALELLAREIARAGLRSSDFIAHLYGGADTMPDRLGVKLNVGERNIERGFVAIDQLGSQLEGVDVGDQVPRTVALDLATGVVTMRRGAVPK